MAKLLIVDDEDGMREPLSRLLSEMGHEVACAATLEEGVRRAHAEAVDVVFLDVRFPEGNGLDALPQIREAESAPEVIIMTGLGDPDGAELATRSGAWDYIEKGSSLEALLLSLARALQYREQKRSPRPPVALKTEGILGSSLRTRECLDLVAQAAHSNANVLLTGETGTGKELFARAIHSNSSRAGRNFVVVDCSAIPETLVESMLFGHEKGAFTGAERRHDGLVKQADGGTLFLDEVGELPLLMQKAFLRVLQERRFRPIGGTAEVTSDFRLVASTNRDLDGMAGAGRFRQDLLFRLRSFHVELPPMRERIDDIKEIATYHIARLCEVNETGAKGVSPDFFAALEAYDWPGNVRELVQAIERALSAAQYDHTLFPKHIPTHIRIRLARAAIHKEASPHASASAAAPNHLPQLREVREAAIAEAERHYLEELLRTTQRNIKLACEISGLSRSRLYTLLQKYKISAR